MKTSHPLSAVTRATKGIQTILISLLFNALLGIIKIIAGVIGNSYALIADGIESITDIFSSFIVWGGIKIGTIPADEDHPFGHGRAESLAALVVSFLLIVAAGIIVVQSIREIHTPHHAPKPFTLFVLIGVIIIKEALFRFVFKTGQSVDSLSLKVDAWHHRSDAITSLAAFIGIYIAVTAGKGYESADDWAALFVSGIIAFNGFRLFKFSVDEIMDAAPTPEIEGKIRAIASGTPDVMKIEKCRVRK